jgi:hypothetical protein
MVRQVAFRCDRRGAEYVVALVNILPPEQHGLVLLVGLNQ